MAYLGWIDFSKAQRDQVTAVLARLAQEGSVDELGIGVVRDALADQLFPGISTIHTRARYFYLIPYILWDYCRLPDAQKRRRPLSRFLEEKEQQMINRLRPFHKLRDGIIGFTKSDLVRYPSAIYWRGLQQFGFIKANNQSISSYIERFSKINSEESLHYLADGDEKLTDDADANFRSNPMGLAAPVRTDYESFKRIELLPEEAEDFGRRIRTYARGTLLAEIIDNQQLFDLILKLEYSGREGFVAFAPVAINEVTNLKLAATIRVAHDFSVAMFGAHITYNQAVQEALGEENGSDAHWEHWCASHRSRYLDIGNLSLETLESCAPGMRIKEETRRFISNWLDLLRQDRWDDARRFQLVEQQEYRNKKHKARLRNKYFKRDDPGKWLGFDFLEYRFNNARRILFDLKNPKPDDTSEG